jgi:monoamine oxidase
MTDAQGDWTRRRFLEKVGAAGGAAALYETMTALGLIGVPDAWAGPPRIPRESGNGTKVLILGAGIGGLTAAYELSKAGYQCKILEAQNRAGGRNLTARNGTIISEESRENGVTHQRCRFDKGLYVNMGPGRLPYHHRRILHYCQTLGVALELYVMETTANLYQTDLTFAGEAQPNRHITHDARGYIAELLAKAINMRALDQELNVGDRDNLLDLLKTFGDLGRTDASGNPSDPFTYGGSTRSGYERPLSVVEQTNPKNKYPLTDLLSTKFWQNRFYQPQDRLWQATLFQPVGGMDQIVTGFLRKVGDLIDYEAVVTEIGLVDDGVEVTYRDGSGRDRRQRADYCISNIPMPVLTDVPANFSSEFKQAVDQVRFTRGCKVGWQANSRFWENDENQIYGGISWTDHLIAQMWYPSNDYFSKKGTLTGVYIPGAHKPTPAADDPANKFGQLSLRRRLEIAREGGMKFHPEIGDDRVVPLDRGLSIAWQNVPFQRGQAADYDPNDPRDTAAYARLLSPDGRFFVVGDQVSPLPGWQEGAVMSAHHVIEQVAGRRARVAGPAVQQTPERRVRQAPTSRDVSG